MQVTVSMLCSDGTATASSLAINAVSAALMCSNIPWNGPLAAVQMACNESQQGTIVHPSVAELAGCSMSGIYVGTADSVLLADFQVSLLVIPPSFHPRPRAPTPCPPALAVYSCTYRSTVQTADCQCRGGFSSKACCAKPIFS